MRRSYLRAIAGLTRKEYLRRDTSRFLIFRDQRCGCEQGFAQGISGSHGLIEVAKMSEKSRSLSPSKSTLKALNFTNYDFVGFDLDHTLSTYNLKNLFTNHFNYLVKVLNGQRGYQISPELTPALVDFMSRGLIIDIDRGNLLKVTYDGEIARASHGTRALDLHEISKIYGSKRQWKPLKEVMSKKFLTWKARIDEMYCFMDFTDAAVTAVYALAVDSGKKEKLVWSDVIEALRAMYSDEEWSNDIFNHADLYLNKTSEKVKQWISKLKPNTKVALITSNWYDYVPRIAVNTLGPNWQSLFDFCVFHSKKPAFFTERAPFLDLTGKEAEFTLAGNYTRGSMSAIKDALAKNLNREPNCVYIGDSPMHDFMFTGVDYIAVVEELKAEGLMGTGHPSSDFISSSFWGSYLFEGDKPTLFGKISMDGEFCAPDLEYFAERPIDHDFVKSLPRRPESNSNDNFQVNT